MGKQKAAARYDTALIAVDVAVKGWQTSDLIDAIQRVADAAGQAAPHATAVYKFMRDEIAAPRIGLLIAQALGQPAERYVRLVGASDQAGSTRPRPVEEIAR